MKIVVLGATGHVGTFLVPRLVDGGHQVVAVSRGQAKPYVAHEAWDAVERVSIDRDAAEAAGDFGRQIAAMAPDAVVDLICFTPESAEQLVDALDDGTHLVHIGTIWTHGHPSAVPMAEEADLDPFGSYGIQKRQIEVALQAATAAGRVRATVVHPGHIVGPGWWPLGPAGHFAPETFAALARGEELALPNLGLETVHHVHADDVAALVVAALDRPEASVGESFHAVSPQALTLRGYAAAIARWFGREPALTFAPFAEWAAGQREEEAATTWEHIVRSPSCSMAKAQRLLGFVPAWSSLAAVQQAVRWQAGAGAFDLEAAAEGSAARDARP